MTATALLLFIPLAAPTAPPTEPPANEAIGIRTLATWVGELRSTDPTTQKTAFDALVKAGPKAKDAVSLLVKMLDEKDAQVYQIVEILGAIGPNAKEAVPALLALLPKEPGFGGYMVDRIATAVAKIEAPKIEATRVLLMATARCTPSVLLSSQTLAEYPTQVVAQVVELCADKNPRVRAKAALVLGTLKQKEFTKVPTKSLFEKAGDGAKGVVPALEKLLADDDIDVRLVAAVALAQFAPESAEKAIAVVIKIALDDKLADQINSHPVYQVFTPVPVPAANALVALFDHKSDRVRNWAISILTSIPVREPIEAALKDGKTTRIRESAALAIGARYSSGTDSIPALKAALADPEFAVRFAAGKSLVNVGPRGSAANVDTVPVLVEGLQQKAEAVRFEASQTLLSVGPTAKTAVPALKLLLDDPAPGVRFEAALALVGIDSKDAAGAVPALTEGLKTSDSHATRAAKALGTLGPVAKDAVPELLKKFDAGAPLLRLSSAEAVARIDPAHAPKAAEAIATLLADKKYKSSLVRRNSLTALKGIGPAARPALPVLAELLKDNGPFHTEVAITMIVIDPDGAKPAFEWLHTVMTSGDDDGYDNLDHLVDLGPAAKPLVPDLLTMLKSKDSYRQENAVLVLGAIGPGAKDAVPELKKLAGSGPDSRIKTAAAEAIKKIEAK